MSTITTVPSRFRAAIRRAFSQFLALPLATVLFFVGLNALVYVADQAWQGGQAPAGFRWLGQLIGDRAALGSLLATVASSIITVTSITFSLLLIAVQQGAAAMTAQVTDQFMARRVNQLYFGYFVGLSVFVLMTLVTNTDYHRPVFGTSLALTLTAAALCLIIVMIYNTIDQMRPAQIVLFIHGKILRARADDHRLLAQTRRTPHRDWPVLGTLRSRERGYVVGIDTVRIQAAITAEAAGCVELELLVPRGAYRALNDPLFALRVRPDAALSVEARERIGTAAITALDFDDGRDLRHDASYGLQQLATIAWTSISTAKSNPSPGVAVIQALRDIIARWNPGDDAVPEDPGAGLVLADGAPDTAADALEAIIVVASESIQPHTLAEAVSTLAILLEHVCAPLADRLADIARRALSSLGEHVLTRELESALRQLEASLRRRGDTGGADAVAAATQDLARSLGTLNSRSTRVPAPS